MNLESSLFIRLYLDEDVHKRIASALRLRSFDVISTHEAGRCGCTDEEQLTFAARERRAIFTCNTLDYLRLHIEWSNRGMRHAGIVVSDQLPIGETARRLLALLNQVTDDEMKSQIRWLQAFK